MVVWMEGLWVVNRRIGWQCSMSHPHSERTQDLSVSDLGKVAPRHLYCQSWLFHPQVSHRLRSQSWLIVLASVQGLAIFFIYKSWLCFLIPTLSCLPGACMMEGHSLLKYGLRSLTWGTDCTESWFLTRTAKSLNADIQWSLKSTSYSLYDSWNSILSYAIVCIEYWSEPQALAFLPYTYYCL